MRCRQAVLRQNLEDYLPPGCIGEIERKHVCENEFQGIVRKCFQVAHDFHELPGAVRISDVPGIGHLAQLRKQKGQLLQVPLPYAWSATLQESHLTRHVRIVHDVATEYVPTDPEEVIAEKRQARPIREHDHPKARTHLHELLLCIRHVLVVRSPSESSRIVLPNNAAAVADGQFAVVCQGFQNAHDFQGCLVCLVDDQAAPMADRAHEGAVLALNDTCLQGLRQQQRLNGRVTVQLHVLPLASEQLQQPVRHFVLARALVADQQQVVAQLPIQQHVPKCFDVLRRVDELHLRHQLLMRRHALGELHQPNSKHAVERAD
mmetsp:Transcript_91531/g.296302  ORF Transcript_91531/g.296302 Transcript_91531/m.296302 type:complete len:319 (+) Transcript_91531:514-1470(+)